MRTVLRRFFSLVRNRQLLGFLLNGNLGVELRKHLTAPGTLFFFLFRSLPLEINLRRRSRGEFRFQQIRLNIPRSDYCPLEDEDLVRLCNAYEKMSAAAGNIERSSAYFVGGLWEDWRQTHHSSLVQALLNGDLNKLRNLFANMGSEDFTIGISLAGDSVSNQFGRLIQSQRLRTLMENYRRLRPGARVSPYPAAWGTFPGAEVDGGVITPSAPRMSHNARLLSELAIAAGGAQSILEIGGGYGGIPFHLRLECDFEGTYTNLDIPEVLIVCAGFLMATVGSEDIYLFGDRTGFGLKPINLLPHYEFPSLEVDSFGVVFNSHSLTEMNYSTVREYLHQIERIRPRFFLHMNHEFGSGYTSGGTHKSHALIGPAGIDFDHNFFQRVHRGPEILTNDGALFGEFDYWENLYLRSD